MRRNYTLEMFNIHVRDGRIVGSDTAIQALRDRIVALSDENSDRGRSFMEASYPDVFGSDEYVPWSADRLFFAGVGNGYLFLGYKGDSGEVRVFAGCRDLTLAQAEAHWLGTGYTQKEDCVHQIQTWADPARFANITVPGKQFSREHLKLFFTESHPFNDGVGAVPVAELQKHLTPQMLTMMSNYLRYNAGRI